MTTFAWILIFALFICYILGLTKDKADFMLFATMSLIILPFMLLCGAIEVYPVVLIIIYSTIYGADAQKIKDDSKYIDIHPY